VNSLLPVGYRRAGAYGKPRERRVLAERWETLRRRSLQTSAAVLLAFGAVMPAHGQDLLIPPADIPDGAAPSDPMPLAPLLPHQIDPAALLKPGSTDTPPAAKSAPAPAGFTLEAKLTDTGAPIAKGVVWRIFGEKAGADGKLPLLREASGGIVHLALGPGSYLVHAAYGRAGIAKRVVVNGEGQTDTIILNAGGLKLSAIVGKDQTLTGNQSAFDIYPGSDQSDDERNPIVAGLHSDQIVRLNAGTYHVVSRYGDANAVVRADIKVEAGKLTEAALFQKAARITLKLVSDAGGEALANTSWSVLTQEGDSVFDSVGAFPDVVLAIGDYTAVAKHDNLIHERNFTVEAGRDREVEVLAK
jgi:hypothetical protein